MFTNNKTTNKRKLPPLAKDRKVFKKLIAEHEPLTPHVHIVEKEHSNKRHYLKSYKNGSRLPESEAYCAAICRYLATPELVPSVHAYYNTSYELTETASQEIINFQSIAHNPLCKNDFKIKNDAINIKYQLNKLMLAVTKLLQRYQTENTTYINNIKKAVCSIFSKQTTVNTIAQCLQDFQNNEQPFSDTSLQGLKIIIKNRKKTLALENQTDLVQQELNELIAIEKYIKRALEINSSFTKVTDSKKIDDMIMQQLILLETHDDEDNENNIIKGLATALTTRFIYKEEDLNNKNLTKHGKNIDFARSKYPISFELDEHNKMDLESILRSPQEENFACSPHNIYFFPDIKTNLYHWVTKQPEIYKLIFAVCDKYLDQLAKGIAPEDHYGQVVTLIVHLSSTFFQKKIEDVPYYELLKQLIYRITVKIKALFLQKNENEMLQEDNIKTNANLIRQVLNSLLLTYHDQIIQIENKAFELLGDPKNNFSLEDNLIFKKLNAHPIFIFYKYKTFLKAIVTDRELYRSLAELHIADESLIQAMVEDESSRISEIQTSLLQLTDFKNFLEVYGDFAFDLIKKECLSYRSRYEKKLQIKPHFNSLINAIDSNVMQNQFNLIKNEMGNVTKYKFRSQI